MSIIVQPLSEPIRQRFGILESVAVESVDDKHWQAGEPIFFRAAGCGPVACYPLGGCVDGVYSSDYGDGKVSGEGEFGEACALEVIAGSICSARTLLDPTIDVRAEAVASLTGKEGIALEAAIWEGLSGDDSKLSCVPEVTNVCPDAVSALKAVAAIENAFSNCGIVGYIHVPSSLLPHLDGVVSVVDGVLRTMYGSVVIAGAGYGPTAELGDDGATTSVFGTGAVRLFEGDLRFSPDVTEGEMLAAVNATRNSVEWFAERSWAVGFDPCCGPFEAIAKFC